MARPAAECGTRSGYRRHVRRQEEPCQPCAQANLEYGRGRSLSREAAERKAERRRQLMADPERRARQLAQQKAWRDARRMDFEFTAGERARQRTVPSKSDPERRARDAEKRRQKYADDPAYRARALEQNRQTKARRKVREANGATDTTEETGF